MPKPMDWLAQPKDQARSEPWMRMDQMQLDRISLAPKRRWTMDANGPLASANGPDASGPNSPADSTHHPPVDLRSLAPHPPSYPHHIREVKHSPHFLLELVLAGLINLVVAVV